MIGLGASVGIAENNLHTYEERLRNALRALAQHTGSDHRERFAHWYRHWGALAEMEGEVDRTGKTHRRVAAALPCFAELVITLRDTHCQVGWLSGGRSGAHLAETVSGLLHSTLSAHLACGGDRARAEALAAVFAAAFPDLNRLRDMSALAQVFLVAVVPAGDSDALKLYLNPRVSAGEARTHLERIVDAVGADRAAFGELVAGLYNDRGTRLYGLGVDLIVGQSPRLKLYVRVDRDPARALLQQFEAEPDTVAFLDAFSHDALADEIELALALRDGVRSVKVTQFWGGRTICRSTEEQILLWINRAGFDRTAIDSAIAPLRAPAATSVQRSPIHALGVEAGASVGQKLNVYLQPEL
ncbi:MAG: hypothetical protein AAF658_02330 [Myxococcota bacterium]